MIIQFTPRPVRLERSEDAPPIAARHLVPLDQKVAWEQQRQFASTLLSRLRPLFPPLPVEPQFNLLPNGFWKSHPILGFSHHIQYVVSLPMAGSQGVLAGDENVRLRGLDPFDWLRVLLHETVHLFEWQSYGPAVRRILSERPMDTQRAAWRMMTRIVASHFGLPLHDIGSANWPASPPDSLLDSFHADCLLAPPARIGPTGGISLLGSQSFDDMSDEQLTALLKGVRFP